MTPGTYDEQLDEGLSECLDNVVDFHIQFVCAEKRLPPGENGVCNFENTDVHLGIGRRKSANELLQTLDVSQIGGYGFGGTIWCLPE